MRRSFFVKIDETCVEKTWYFKHRRNATGLLGFSGYQKISSTMRVLAYGILVDYDDEYIRIGEDTTIESVRRICKVMIFEQTYLRVPNEQDTIRLMGDNVARGWPGMLGSIDCAIWRWKNCPKAWHVQYCGKSHDPTILLEVVASQDLWLWHYFLGLSGCLNDINVLQRSHLFSGLLVMMLRLATTSSTTMSTTWDTTLRMTFIRSGQHL
jgi:hypothetical protein